MARLRRRRPGGAIEPWGRGQLLALLAAAVAAGLVLVTGLVVAVRTVVDPGAPQTAAATAAATAPGPVAGSRDEIAQAPMVPVAPSEGRPGARIAITRPPIFTVPAPTATGPAGVPAGFPQTPAGAVGQLGAIVVATLGGMDVPQAAQVYAAWSAPGAPPVEDWPLMAGIRSFLESAGLSALEGNSFVRVTPVGAQVKGTDGPGWTLACVLVTIRARVKEEARAAYGHCARMAWLDQRWVIGRGEFPAPAPGTWPATEAMLRAGWQSWEEPHPD